MALNPKIQSLPHYLLMTYEGLFEVSSIGPTIDQVLEACEKYQSAKVALDFRSVTGEITTMERFELGSGFALKYMGKRMTGKIPSCRFAFVGNYPLLDPRRFGETVAKNRGVNVKVFVEMEKALEWLNQDEK